MKPDRATLTAFRQKYEIELFERTIPFWLKNSLDTLNGGYYTCLSRDGAIYDTTKYVWLQGRQVWMLSKLYRCVEAQPILLDSARLGIEFLRSHAYTPDGQVYFSLDEVGRPKQLQRKMYSACFLLMALAEFGRASGDESYLQEAAELWKRIWDWAFHPEKLGRPNFAGVEPSTTLATPMILLNVIEELTDGKFEKFRAEVELCIEVLMRHVHADQEKVFENVGLQGQCLQGIEGRLLNPGHAIEGGWFLHNWAIRLGRNDLSEIARDMIRWSFRDGWDQEFGGIHYFLDSSGREPVQLEWDMKLWWPHCEALYAHLLNYSLFSESEDWSLFALVDAYSWDKFRDPEYGEWYGYLNRQGTPTHHFKGGPYKGCFHLPRALWLCWSLLKKLEESEAR